MQVRARDAAGAADRADSLAAREARALRDIDAAQVVVHGDEPFTVVEEHREPVEEIIADLDHGARRRRGDRRSLGSGDIQSTVRLPLLVVENAPQTETAGDAPLRGPVEGEAVGRGLAEGGECADKRLLFPRDPPQVFGRGLDLSAVSQHQVLGLVIAAADVEADRARVFPRMRIP